VFKGTVDFRAGIRGVSLWDGAENRPQQSYLVDLPNLRQKREPALA
jgi:hypothetical protein